MKKMLALLILVSLFTAAPNAQAQDLKIGISAGMTYFSNGNYLGKSIFNNGFGVGDKSSYGITARYEMPESPLSFTAQFLASPLEGMGQRFIYNYVPDPAANMINPFQSVKVSSDLYAIGMGVSYKLFESGRFAGYFGADVIGAYFGKFTVENKSFFGSQTDEVSGFFRLGAGVGPTLEVNLVSELYLDLSAKYSFYNLIGKEGAIYGYDYYNGEGTNVGQNVKEDNVSGANLTANLMWAL